METVCIIIPAHNEGDNVRRTVDSILAHTDHPSFEIILIDDGSVDSSGEFLDHEPYRSDQRLRRFRFEQPVGSVHARHQGVRLAQAPLLLFLDAHMAVPSGWLAALVRAVERWGPWAAITPAVSTLESEAWSPNPPTGHVPGLDNRLDLVWRDGEWFVGPVSTAGGCCLLFPRALYDQVGGFDLGLRRWGCEFVDLIFKVYAAGGLCWHESSVVVGHLFRSQLPYALHYRDFNYNKLRTGYIHLPEQSFCRLQHDLADQPWYAEALTDFEADLPELDCLRTRQRTSSQREPDWLTRMFLPGLREDVRTARTLGSAREDRSSPQTGDRAVIPRRQSEDNDPIPTALGAQPGGPGGLSEQKGQTEERMTDKSRWHRVCPKCGARNIGPQATCLKCHAPLPVPAEAAAGRPCPRCGRQSPASTRFCVHCGTPLQAAPAPAVCPRCGARASPGLKFCTQCGTRLSGSG